MVLVSDVALQHALTSPVVSVPIPHEMEVSEGYPGHWILKAGALLHEEGGGGDVRCLSREYPVIV